MAGLSGNWLKEGVAVAGVGEVGVAEVMRDYPGLGWGTKTARHCALGCQRGQKLLNLRGAHLARMPHLPAAPCQRGKNFSQYR
jgi:hypothetical protein